MKKLIFAGALALATLTSCSNETQNDDLTNKPKTENSSKVLARYAEGDPIEINPEIQAEIDATMNGTNPNGKLICSVGVGQVKGHSCLELWGNIYEYSWEAIQGPCPSPDMGCYLYDTDTGGYQYNYSFHQNTKCRC